MTLSGGVAMLGLVMGLADTPASSIALAIDITALMPMSNAELRAMVGWRDYRALEAARRRLLTWVTSEATYGPTPPRRGAGGQRSCARLCSHPPPWRCRLCRGKRDS